VISVEMIQLSPLEAVQRGAESLTQYGRIFFPRTFRQKSPEFHEEIGRALYSPARYNAFKIFRDGAKTTLLRVFTSQRIAYMISRTIMYVSVSQQHACFSVRWIKRQVQFNTKWAQTFGLEKGEKWTDEWCEIKCTKTLNDDGTPVIITLLAMGITGQIRGFNPDDFRPDLIIIDDVLNEENTATPDQRQKIEALLFGALLNSLAPASEAPWAKAVFLQTPLNRDDAIEKCMRDPQWNPYSFSVFDKKGESSWPARWPTETLRGEKEAAIRRGQLRLWMREKECTIVSGEDQAIDTSAWKHYDLLPEVMDVVIAIDPASSDSPTADDHAIVALGFRGVDCYVLDYKLSKGTMPDKAANDFFSLVLLYGPRKAAVEAIGYQRVLAWHLEQEMIKRKIFVAVDRIQDKRRKADRIMQAIPALAAYGHFFIKPSMEELLTQANDYNPEEKNPRDDLLDAIAMGIVAMNPALRQAIKGDTLEGEYSRIEDESQYEDLSPGGCP